MYASVGFGAISAGKIIARILEEYRKESNEENLEAKLEELSKETIRVLELTKKKAENYSEVRKKLDYYLRNSNNDEALMKEWQDLLDSIEI